MVNFSGHPKIRFFIFLFVVVVVVVVAISQNIDGFRQNDTLGF